MMYFYETGKNEPSDKFLRQLVKLEVEAGINESIKSAAGNQPIPDAAAMQGGKVPVISWAHAGDAECYEELPESWQEHVTADVGDADAFVLQLRGESMEPRYYEGDLLIVSPNRRASNGGLVVCKFAEGDGIIFRQLQVVGTVIRLVPINVRWVPSDHAEEDFEWIYPVVEMRRRLRK